MEMLGEIGDGMWGMLFKGILGKMVGEWLGKVA